MSDEEQQPGQEALLEVKKLVQITIRNYLKELTEVLRKKKIIELSLYNEVNDLQSHELLDTKAREWCTNGYKPWCNRTNNIISFLWIFFGGPQNSRKTVKMLDKVYGGPKPVVQQEGT